MNELYLVQTSKQPDRRSGYKLRWALSNAVQAELMYQSLNIGNGYRKRLIRNSDHKVIARAVSERN